MHSRGKTIAKLIHGLEQLSCQQKVGDILITATRTQSFHGKRFSEAFNKFRKQVLCRSFAKGILVVTRSDRGRLHSHIAVEMSVAADNFDWLSFEQSERYYKLYQLTKSSDDLKFFRYYLRKYRRSLPLEWQRINTKLMREGKRYGLGRVFLTPVRKSMIAYRWYLVSNVPKYRDKRDKGIRYVTSWGMDCLNGFQLLNKQTIDYRRKLAKFANGLQLTAQDYNISLRSVLGRRWFFRVKDLIRNIDNLSAEQQTEYQQLHNTLQTHLLRSS